jgi:hypothetical protein
MAPTAGGPSRKVRRQIVEERLREDPESPRLVGLERDLRNLAHLTAFALPVIETLASWPREAAWESGWSGLVTWRRACSGDLTGYGACSANCVR